MPAGSPAAGTPSPQAQASRIPAHRDVRNADDPSRTDLKPYLRTLNRVRLRPTERDPVLARLRAVMVERGLAQVDERIADISTILEKATKLTDTEYQQQRRRMAMRIRERSQADRSPATSAPVPLEKGTATPG